LNKEPVLILGGRSDIGLAVAHRFAAAGHPIQLAARNAETLANDQSDIQLRYNVDTTLHNFDALATDSHVQFVDDLPILAGIVICAIGLLGDQADNELDISSTIRVMRSNYEGPASILSILANKFEARGNGTLVGISSVAGERGRASNYVYGSAKAGFTAFLSGLRNRLAKKGVHVVTVLPGFIATKMTDGLDLPVKLTARPEELATCIEKAIIKKKNIIYVKPIWEIIMMVIRNIPERVFKGLKI
jgi:decaprenylphospho-beta-D-erythro-pentofuranosid-2-ulose 2-reductase